MTVLGVDLAVTTTSLLLSLLDVEQEIMTGSPHLNSFSGLSNKIIRWPRLTGDMTHSLVTLQEEERRGEWREWWVVCVQQPSHSNQLPRPGSHQTDGRVGLCPGGQQ